MIKDLMSRYSTYRYDMVDFWKNCPYSLRLLSGTRNRAEVSDWRHVYCFWMVMSGKTYKEVADSIGKSSHATVLNPLRRVSEVLESDKFGSDSLRKKVFLMFKRTNHGFRVIELENGKEFVLTKDEIKELKSKL